MILFSDSFADRMSSTVVPSGDTEVVDTLKGDLSDPGVDTKYTKSIIERHTATMVISGLRAMNVFEVEMEITVEQEFYKSRGGGATSDAVG
jgi:hypothetical protein